MQSRKLVKVTLLGLLGIAAISAAIALPYFFAVPALHHNFDPGHRYHVWALILTDMFISASYAGIFAGLAWTIGRLRLVPQLSMHLRAFRLFGAFLILCAATRFSEAITAWWPIDQFLLTLKTLCALISIPAAALLIWKLPGIVDSVCELTDLLSAAHQQTEALRKSEAFLDRTGRIAGIGGWEADLITNKVTWSVETYRIHGVPLDYVPTLEQGLAFYTPESKPIITAALELACSKGQGWDLELSAFRVDGSPIWVRTSGTAELLNGKPVRLSGAFQDITSRVAERNALKQANELVTLATDSGHIGIWDWDIVNNVLSCDRWMHRLHGIEQVEGHPDVLRWREQLHPDDKDRVVKAMYDAIDGTAPYDTEFRVVWPDGSVHNLRATAQVTRDESGRALRMVGANWDVSEARKLTVELAQQHELLHVTFQSIGDGVITTDAKCHVAWLNPVAEQMTGWPLAEAIGKPLTEIFNILNYETRLPVANPVVACLATGEAGKLAPDTILISREGTRYGIDDSAAPIRGVEGEILGAVLVFHDVTEQRRLFFETTRVAKVELKLKDDFLSRVSHELRSPLTSIYSFSSIIADELAGETTPEQQEYLEIILKNVGQLQAMIEDLLTVTQANEGKLSIEPQRISATDAVTDALHTIQAPAARKHISLSSKIGEGLPAAYADPTRLLQVLIILLDNAVKFTPIGGRVHVNVSEGEPGFLLFEVADTGCGIPPEKRQRVFENLYQITGPEQSDTSHAGRNGLGLGLHIAKDLVTRQGGQIWITGASLRGSVFSFTLPVFAGDLEGTSCIEGALQEIAGHA
jgi:PAS domain S-box-containing protein